MDGHKPDRDAGEDEVDSFNVLLPAGGRLTTLAVMDDVSQGDRDPSNVVRLWPEWGPRDLVPDFIPISDSLRLRLLIWNRTWQSVLDPVKEIRWPDPDVGRQWIAEGESLVRDLQKELGPQLHVVEGFRVYDPEGEQTPGP